MDIELSGHTIKGWEVVFYVFGAIGILWFPAFYWCVYDNPDDHPGCCDEEVALIKEGKRVRGSRSAAHMHSHTASLAVLL